MSIDNLKMFFDSMRADIQQLDQLTQCLDSQYELLSSRQHQPLTDLNERMLRLLDQLRQSNGDREAFLQHLGLPGDKTGLEILQAKLPAPAQQQVGELMQQLNLKARTCTMMNERAGKLLASQRQLMTRIGGMRNLQAYPDSRL